MDGIICLSGSVGWGRMRTRYPEHRIRREGGGATATTVWSVQRMKKKPTMTSG